MTTEAAAEEIRIVIVDDHEVVALGLKALLSDEEGLTVVGLATTVEQAQRVLADLTPDVALVDYRLPDGSGLDVITALRTVEKPPGVVMVTAAADRRVMSQALDAGCLGFLSKNADHADLIASVRAAAKGESHFTPDVVRQRRPVVRSALVPPVPLFGGPAAVRGCCFCHCVIGHCIRAWRCSLS